MKDHDKSKQQLIQELNELRKQIHLCKKLEQKHEQVEEVLRQHKEKLKEQLEELDHLYNSAPVGLCLMDTDLRFVCINERLAAINGHPVQKHIGRTLREVIPDIAKIVEPIYRRVIETGEPELDFEVEGITAANPDEPMFGLVSYYPLKSADGTVRGVSTVVLDITKRKQAEEARRKSEERFRRLSSVAFEGLVIHKKGFIIDANQKLADMFGYELSEFIGMNALDCTAPEYREQLMKNILAGYDKPYEVVGLRKDGSTFPLEIIGRTTIYQDEVVRVAALRDITERKKAKEALLESEEKFKSLAEKSPNMIFINIAGKVVYVNEQAQETMGYTKEEFYSPDFDFLNLLAPESRDLAAANFKKHLQGQEIPACEYTLLTKDGKKFEAIQATRLIKYDGQSAILGIITDITERKLAEAALKKEKDTAKLYLDIAGVMFVAIDKNQKVILVNQKGCEILGYDEHEIIGKNWFDHFLPPSIRDEVRAVFDELMQGEEFKVKYYENPVLSKSGEERLIAWHNELIRDDEGHIVGTLSSGEDITQRKQAEMDLKRSHAQLRRLSAHLQSVREKERKNIVREIHDELGQTLTALKMDVSWLKKRIAPDEKILSEKIHSMLGTIDRVIVWVNEVSAKLRPRLLDELGVKDAIHWLAEDLQKRTDIQCTFSCNFSDFQFDNDLSTAIFRISQEALTNIVRHAKASRVQIDLNQQNGELILKITDNGKGITEKEINSSTSFGLMGMRERMHTWGGKVEISGSKNRGTTLVVKLPISKVQEVVK